jgi:obg-like ATPase 1
VKKILSDKTINGMSSFMIVLKVIIRLKQIFAWVGEHSPGSKIIPVSVAMEQKIFAMSDEEKEKFLLESKTKSKLAQIIQSGFESIQLVNFFTCGEDEVRGMDVNP